jgi:hypothetical protein
MTETGIGLGPFHHSKDEQFLYALLVVPYAPARSSFDPGHGAAHPSTD